MTMRMIIAMPGNEAMAAALAAQSGASTGSIELRHFPDGESYVRFTQDVSGLHVILVCTLDHPDSKLLTLLFAAKTARELGATRITLVAPYLAYMRQDCRFHAGEAVTSRHVAALLSDAFDALITVDPHLHRYKSLSDIYTLQATAVQAAPLLSAWIAQHAGNAVLIGPDSESEQWVAAVAGAAATPFTVLEKVRHGDRNVTITVKDSSMLDGRQPVFVDDIISSGRTMLAAIEQVGKRTQSRPICLAVHGLFADNSDALLAQAGAQVVTTNTVPHTTSLIDVSAVLASCLGDNNT